MEPLPVLCAAPVGAAAIVYVLVGGLDLGVGLLTLMAPRARDRAAMLGSLSPSWYGGIAWLAPGAFLLGGTVPAGMSLARTVWPWLALLLLALLVRTLAYALRDRTDEPAGALGRICDAVIGPASGLAVLGQGLMLGAVLGGMPDPAMPPGASLVLGLVCAAGLAGAYALLGAGWLVWRTDGATRTFGREVAHAAVVLTACAAVAACAWSVLAGPAVAGRRFAVPGATIPVALVASVLGLGVWIWRGLWSAPDRATLDRVVAMILVVSAGLTASLWVMAPETGRGGPALQFTPFDALLAVLVLLACVAYAAGLLRPRIPAGGAKSPERPSHVGRRVAALDNNASHLS